MIFGKTKIEMQVGIFVFIGMIILAVFVLSIGGFKSWSSGYYLKFNFNFVNGVKVGAPVRYAGVDVGQVKKLNFIYSNGQGTKVQVVGWVKNEVKIPADSTVWVNTLGLLGEKYIEILPGKDHLNYAFNKQIFEGNDPLPMQEVERLVKKTAQDIDDTVLKIKNGEGTIGKLLTDDSIYNEVEGLVIDLKKHPWKLFWKGKE